MASTAELSKKSNEAFQKSIATFRAGIGNIRDQISHLKLEKAKYEWSTTQLSEEKDVLMKQSEMYRRDIAESERSVAALKDENSAYQRQLEEARKDNTELEAHVLALEEDVKKYRIEYTSLKSHLEGYEYETRQLEKQHFSAAQNQKVLQEQCKILEAEIKRKENAVESISIEKASQEKKLNKIIASVSAERTRLEQKLSDAFQCEKENESKFNDQSDEITDLTNKNERLEVSVKKCKALLAKSKDVASSQDQELKETKEKNAALQSEVERNRTIEEEFKILTKTHRETLADKEELAVDLKRYQVQNENLLSQLQELIEIESNLNKSIDELSLVNESNLMQMQKLEGDEMRKQYSYEQNKCQLEYVIERLRGDIQVTRGESSEQRKELSELKQDNLTKGFRIQELERQLREKDALLNARKTT